MSKHKLSKIPKQEETIQEFVERLQKTYDIAKFQVNKRLTHQFSLIQRGKSCILCLQEKIYPEQYGDLIHHKASKISVHYFCLLMASGLVQQSEDSACDLAETSNAIHGFLIRDILQEYTRASKLCCSYCKHKGATIGCNLNKCKKKFHFSCGLEHGALSQFYDNFRSYCVNHKPSQCFGNTALGQGDGEASKANNALKPTTCCICLDNLTTTNIASLLIAPCCKNTMLHRGCVEKQALSFGKYYFKCPACNDRESFTNEMLRMGVYIPERDASWETPDAYEDLLHEDLQCDVTECKCRKGRSYHSPKSIWAVVYCTLCGLLATHLACSSLQSESSSYACEICQSVYGQSGVRKHLKMSAPNENLILPYNQGLMLEYLAETPVNNEMRQGAEKGHMKRKRTDETGKENGECSSNKVSRRRKRK